MNSQSEFDQTNWNILIDDGLYKRDDQSLKYLTPFIKYYSGNLFY